LRGSRSCAIGETCHVRRNSVLARGYRASLDGTAQARIVRLLFGYARGKPGWAREHRWGDQDFRAMYRAMTSVPSLAFARRGE